MGRSADRSDNGKNDGAVDRIVAPPASSRDLVALPAPARQRRARRAPRIESVAAIDIGSNSIRQLVADVAPGGRIRVIDEMKAAPRLGAGVAETHRLSAHALERATEAVSRMATLARQRGAGHRPTSPTKG